MMDKRAQPRWRQRIKAFIGGYSWLPCPMCGEHFGGHEWAGTLMTGPNGGLGVCANCAEEAQQQTAERYREWYGEPVTHVWNDGGSR